MSEHQATHGNTGPHHPVPVVLNTTKEFKFSFKKQTIVDELGMEKKRPPVTLNVPIPTIDGVMDAMAKDTKVVDFVLDLIEEAIKDQIRDQLSDSDNPVNRQDDLDLNKLTLTFIANLPKSERSGGGISKETWEDWEKDYVAVCAGQREDSKNERAAKIMSGKFSQVRTDKKALNFLRDQLAFWAENTKNLDDFADIFTYLDNRATELLKKDETDLLANLM